MLAKFKTSIRPPASASSSCGSPRERSMLAHSPTAHSPSGRGASLDIAPWHDDEAQRGLQHRSAAPPKLLLPSDSVEAGPVSCSSIQPFLSAEATAAALALESPSETDQLARPAPGGQANRGWTLPAGREGASFHASRPSSATSQASNLGPAASVPMPARPVPAPGSLGSLGGSVGRPPLPPSLSMGTQSSVPRRQGEGSQGGLPPRSASNQSRSSGQASGGPRSLGSQQGQGGLLPVAHIIGKMSLEERVYMGEERPLASISTGIQPFMSAEATAAALADESPSGEDAAVHKQRAPWVDDKLDLGQSRSAGGKGETRGQAGGGSGWEGGPEDAVGVKGVQQAEQGEEFADAGRHGGSQLMMGRSLTRRSSLPVSRTATPTAGGAPEKEGPGAAPDIEGKPRRRPASAGGGIVTGVIKSLLSRASLGGSSKVVPLGVGTRSKEWLSLGDAEPATET